MATTNGAVFTCDRDSFSEFIAENDARAREGWRTITRLNRDGVEVKRLLCASCFKGYQELMTKQDSEFAQFMEVNG